MPKIKLDYSSLTLDPYELLKSPKGSSGDVREPYTINIHRRPEQVKNVEPYTVGEGLMSVSNGSLDHYNLGTNDFRVRSEHIMPEQASMARMEAMKDTSAFYGNGIGQRGQGSQSEEWITLSGTSLRWYQPYDTTLSVMHWDVFSSFNNWHGEYVDSANTYQTGGRKTRVDFRCILDGAYVTNSKRRLAENMFHPAFPGYKRTVPELPGPGLDAYDGDYVTAVTAVQGGGPKYVFPEAHSAVPLSLHYPEALSKGFHEISLQARVRRIPGEAVYVQNIGSGHRDHVVKGRGFFELTAKICLGIRNARVISFL
tara:strand:+ start:6375 stop:7310 length:936 start_codon:yes stop_codon:yes gene_type:complete